MVKPKVVEGCHVPKGWGEEIIIENNELYCGKILIFDAGCEFSMHYHMNKDETWWVEYGEFIYRWIDTETAETNKVVSNGRIFEVSTHHEDSDSYRVIKGDSQIDV